MADLDSKVDKLEELTDANTVISIGGYSFTPAKLMIAGTIISTVLGGLYGAFEIYKDYQSMKEAITTYVAPDLSEINKKIEVLNKQMESTKETVSQATDYTNNIKNDLKADIRRIEKVVDTVERNSKTTERELTVDMRNLRKETELAIKETNANVDKKIQRALDNPLANK